MHHEDPQPQRSPPEYPRIDQLVSDLVEGRVVLLFAPGTSRIVLSQTCVLLGSAWLLPLAADALFPEKPPPGHLHLATKVSLAGAVVLALCLNVPMFLVKQGYPVGARALRAVARAALLLACFGLGASLLEAWTAPAWATALSVALLGGGVAVQGTLDFQLFVVLHQRLRVRRLADRRKRGTS